MDIERLKELKLAVGVVFQHWLDTAATQKGFDNTESKKFFEHDAEHIQEILDEAIARQSVKSEDVAEAIEYFEDTMQFISGEPQEKDHKLAITALQAYQPWVSVSERLPDGDDADKKGRVLTYDKLETQETFPWDCIEEWNATKDNKITHWKPLPEIPKE